MVGQMLPTPEMGTCTLYLLVSVPLIHPIGERRSLPAPQKVGICLLEKALLLRDSVTINHPWS